MATMATTTLGPAGAVGPAGQPSPASPSGPAGLAGPARRNGLASHASPALLDGRLRRRGPARRGGLARRIARHWQWYALIAAPLLWLAVFRYIPMAGVQLAFRDYMGGSIFSGKFVGLYHFRNFFRSPQALPLILNTLGISAYNLAAGFPLPIVLALFLNVCTSNRLKKSVQMITYAPYFISTVVMVGILNQLVHPQFGLINKAISLAGFEPQNIMGIPDLFKSVYVWSGIWQYTGYNSIMYIAVLSGVDPSLHEAAVMDGASAFKRMLHIDIPAIIPTATIMLILNAGNIMNVGFEKVYLMQNSLNMATSDVIATHVYRRGLESAQFSYATAVGLFNSFVNMLLLIIVNQVARRGENSLW
ncbi:MAG: ABC transporter permease subunit [Clostridiales bacterium]|nr:ABC transporter permease subunit [Clostridiales bacterium]